MGQPHILYVITDLEPGGVPLHLARLVRALRPKGFETTVVSLAEPGVVGKIIRNTGSAVMTCSAKGGMDVRVLHRLARHLGRSHPDLVHSLLFHANVASRLAAMCCRFPLQRVVCEIQTVEVERRWHLWVERCLHRFCRFVIGNSPSVIEHLHERAGVPRHRLRLVPGGVDPEALRDSAPAARSAIGLDAKTRVILWVGRLDPVKGLPLLIDAFAQLESRADATLILVGEGQQRPSLEDQIRRLSPDLRVLMPGTRSDVASLLKLADLFVLPSRTEGLPNALLEAMAVGVPIVATDVPGNRDLIQHEENGLLVPYGDASRLAGAMQALLRDRAVAQAMGRRAMQSVDRKWRFTTTVARYERLYRQIAEPHHAE